VDVPGRAHVAIEVTTLRRVATGDLSAAELSAIRALCDEAWNDPVEPFTDEDWAHALGGVHVLVGDAGEMLSHGSVVPRTLRTGGVDLATGYVEAVATWLAHRRRGHGTAVMREITAYVDETFVLGALATGVPSFYERLGWVRWTGPTAVRVDGGERPTPEEDGAILVRFTPTSPDLDPAAPLSCDWRPGDVW
jgi:aminoglycoside 2'-N-acetyltransferase I